MRIRLTTHSQISDWERVLVTYTQTDTHTSASAGIRKERRTSIESVAHSLSAYVVERSMYSGQVHKRINLAAHQKQFIGATTLNIIENNRCSVLAYKQLHLRQMSDRADTDRRQS